MSDYYFYSVKKNEECFTLKNDGTITLEKIVIEYDYYLICEKRKKEYFYRCELISKDEFKKKEELYFTKKQLKVYIKYNNAIKIDSSVLAEYFLNH